jgi:DNA-binding CsgD family transcriptional regulator
MKKLEDKIADVVKIHNRNEDIVYMRLQGKTLQAIGDKHHLTRQRVAIIIKQYEEDAKEK